MRKSAKIRDVADVPINIPFGRAQSSFKGSTDEWDSEIDGYEVAPKLAQEIKDYESRRLETVPDTRTQDELAEAAEINREAVKDYKLPDQFLLEDEIPRRGKLMNHLEFINKLRQGGIKCWYNTEPFRGLIGLRAMTPGKEQLGLRYVCAVKLGRTTEYDTFHWDERGLPLNKKTVGWRSVVLQLISKGILTEDKAHEIFGRPRINDASLLYRKALWEMRNARARGESTNIGA